MSGRFQRGGGAQTCLILLQFSSIAHSKKKIGNPVSPDPLLCTLQRLHNAVNPGLRHHLLGID